MSTRSFFFILGINEREEERKNYLNHMQMMARKYWKVLDRQSCAIVVWVRREIEFHCTQSIRSGQHHHRVMTTTQSDVRISMMLKQRHKQIRGKYVLTETFSVKSGVRFDTTSENREEMWKQNTRRKNCVESSLWEKAKKTRKKKHETKFRCQFYLFYESQAQQHRKYLADFKALSL